MKASHTPKLQELMDDRESSAAESMADQLHLWEWGRWSGKDFIELGYPPCLLRFVAKGWPEKDLRRYVSDITDEEGMRIDAAVARLPFSHRKVVLTIYKAGVPSRKLPEVLGWSSRRIEALRCEAVGILWAWLREGPKTA